MNYVLPLVVCLGLSTAAIAVDPAKDERIVETLLRLKSIDVNTRADLKAAALRHLEQHKGTLKYVELVEKLRLRGVESELFDMAMADPEGNVGVNAATLLMDRGELDAFEAVLSGGDSVAAVRVAKLLGMVGGKEANRMLQPLVGDGDVGRVLRTAAAAGIGRSRGGQQYLLVLVKEGQLPADLNFAVANALFSSRDPQIREEAARHLELPASANAKPLPPVAQLVQHPGDPQRGEQLFKTTATCAKCHKVRGAGKEVGPDLSEIGSKLSPEAAFISILDPSAGISHNYESYTAVLNNGTIIAGLLVTRDDQNVTLRTTEAIDKTFAVDEIDEMIKSETSLMPADLQKTLSVQDLVDVVAYMKTLKKS
jgi:putative heme-binding domain-containing protein